ncbi:methyltransferase domain-containing protein [uncultured Desulfovibrio sp.]|uniref:methyltransferase domain-containing protein n=1 Tax=uncultured Desulfovibrio sp. TaxID=167968 RepID=UPI002805EFF5|nr:methyltransferase domain-containing protein [uncultured Desulfovibrio sp.]
MVDSRIDLRILIKGFCKKNMIGIEIGGGYRPLFRKKDGYNIFTIDYASKDELISIVKKDPALSGMLNNFEDVDAIDDGSEFTDLLSLEKRSIDYIVGVHNFEHIPNPIHFLQRCEMALKDSGRLFLIIPDRRGTFDYFRPYTSIGQWIDAYKENRKVHSFSSLYDMFAYHTDGNGDYGAVNFIHTPIEADKLVNELYNPNKYLDNHGFVYTPSSFIFLTTFIHLLGLTQLRINQILTPENSNFEFLAILDKVSKDKINLKDTAIQMVSESINHRRSFDMPPVSQSGSHLPLRHQLYKRFEADYPMLAKFCRPFAKALYHIYKKFY